MKIRKTKYGTFAAIVAVALLCEIDSIENIHAATIVVSNTADTGPDAPAAGSLRAALATAASGDTVDATGVAGTIALMPGSTNSAELVVTQSVTILGPGPANLTVDANHLSRGFHITPGLTVIIDGLTIVSGIATGALANMGGGIYNDHSTLTVSNCILSGNSAAAGGGIYNDGGSSGSATLTVIASTITGNSAFADGGGIVNDAVEGGATLTVVNSALSDNSAAGGGGAILSQVFKGSGAVTLIDSTFDGNSGVRGGAIHNIGDAGSGTLTVSRCTFNGNSASGSTQSIGGGILNVDAPITVANSTFSGNAAPSGGGIFNQGSALMVANSTFSGNSANSGGGIYNFLFTSTAPAILDIGNTILKAGAPGENIFNKGGTVTSHGFNLSSDGGVTNFLGGTGDLNATGDQLHTDPLLGPLSDNGGPTRTHLPLPGSPAIDQGSSTTIGPLASDTDQRGSPRTVNDLNIGNAPLGDGTDIGAVELAAPNHAPVAKCKNVTVLAEAGGTANASADDGSSDPDGDTITIVQDPLGPYPISTTPVTLTVTDSHGESSSCTATVTVQGVADLLVSLGADKTSLKQGEQLTYTITIHNFGPHTAANVIVNDTLSSGSTFVSASANKGSFTRPPVGQTGTVAWDLGDMLLDDEESAQLVVTVLVKGKTTVTNTATVSSSSFDPNAANNTAAITVSVASGTSGKKK